MKLKKYTCLVLFIIIAGIQLYAQTGKDNLNKYWLYRDRLRKYFVVVDPNDGFGTNIPFWLTKNCNPSSGITLNTGDGNDALQSYIGMLATEYALLKKYGLDYSVTRNELLYALKAVERLDYYAENNFRQNTIPKNPTKIGVQSTDLNGFFVRDDIGESFINDWKWKYPTLVNFEKVNSCFTGGMESNAFEESKDNVWNYIPNLALVTTLVDDNEISQKAKDITYRMVNHMHYTLATDIDYVCGLLDGCFPPRIKTTTIYTDMWRIMNPITNKMTYGGDVEELAVPGANIDGFNYGFAESAYTITGQDLHFGDSKNTGTESWFYYFYLGSGLWPSRFPHFALGTVAGNNKEIEKFHLSDITIMGRLLDNVNNMYDGSKYEHLPLIRSLLVLDQINKGDYSNLDDLSILGTFPNFDFGTFKAFYENLLNEAPNCGPKNLYNQEDPDTKIPNDYVRVDDWSMDNRVTNSSSLIKHIDLTNVNSILEKDNCWHFGVFNGIDYMLLHNLYWLNYVPYGSYNLTDADADNYKELAKDAFDFGLQHMYTNLANQLLYNDVQGTQITSKRTIPATYQIEYTAAVEIELMPGFEAEIGSCFDASINENWSYHYTDPSSLISSCNCYSGAPFDLPKTQSNTKAYLETSDKEQTQTIESNTSVSQKTDITVEISPNPNHGSFIVKVNGFDSKYTVQVYNTVGYLLNTYISNNSSSMPISMQTGGVYYVLVQFGDKTYRQKVICL